MRKVLFTLFVAFLITNAMGQATLPFSYDGGNPVASISSLSESVSVSSTVKTIHVPTAGTLISLLSNEERGIITHLTVTGNISWAEIATIKQNITSLSHLDLSGANVADNTIPGNQFINNSSLTLEALILPSSLTSIGISAFRNCTGLKSIVIRNSVTTIGNSAFEGCFGLTEITLGSAITTIGMSAFRNCSLLNEVVIPNSVTIINNGAFSGCSGIIHLTLGSSVNTIGTAAFSNSVNLKSIVCLGNNPSALGAGAFHFEILSTAYVIVPTSKLAVYKEHTGWGQFSNIFEPGITTATTSINGLIYAPNAGPSEIKPFNVSGVMLTDDLTIAAPTNFEISTKTGAEFTPTSIITVSPVDGMVAETTFYVRLKADLSIGAYNENITVSSTGFTTQNIAVNGAVRNTPETIHVATAGTLSSLLTASEKATVTILTVTGNIDWQEIATIKQHMPVLSLLDLSGANVANNTIPESQFIDNSTLILDAFVLPTSLTSIGVSAFRNCTGLKSIVIGNSVTTIGNSAFEGCYGLIELKLGSAITSIGSSAFRNCSLLNEVVIPNSVTIINVNTFDSCFSLTGITIGNAVTSIGSSAFRNCAQLKEVVMPNSVTIINNGAFSGCSGITHLTLGSSVTTIGTAAFSNSVNVKSIVCLGNNPCTLVAGAFHFEILSTAYVIVPTSKLSVYKEHTGWGQFSNIFEPGITTSTTSINGLIYAPSAGPSEIKPFNVRGVMLTNDLTVAVPTNFEISTKTGSEFTPTNIITVSPVDGMVAETTFYVRLKADLSIGTYNESVTVSSTGFTTQNIVLNGAVRTTPETIHVTTAGTLSSLLSANEKATITKLTVTGNIDARDFVCMRDEMTVLADLNLKDANIVAYHGNFGTNETMLSYPENELPNCAFFNYFGSVSKTTLTAIVLPNSVNSLGHRAFYNCNSLKKIVCLTSIPPVVTDWGESLVGISATGKICVPIGTVPVYKSATGWYLFNIVEYKLMVSSQLATQVSQTSAKLNGSIDLIAASAVQEHGFIWNTIGGSAESESVINFGVADFESNFDATITDLSPGATYIARAFAVDDNGIIYGKESVFTTLMPDYELIVNVSSGGLVYSGAVLINNHSTFKGSHGSSLHFKFEPDSGYYITALFYNGNDVFSQISSNQFTATNLEGNCELSVTFSSAVKNILVEEAGSLNQRLSSREREIITDLTISGFIDSRDFKFMRDSMPILTMLDISAATINGYSGLHGTSIVNEEVIYPANEIPINSFSNNYIAAIPGKLSLNTILLPHNATSLGVGAFANCYELSSVLIGGSLSTIGEYAFTGCYKLESISIPASVTSIGSGAFAGCGFVGITLPEFLNYLGAEAFTGCRSLTAITIPSLITKIEQSTFAGCANLTNVVLSNSVNIIGGNAFVDCDGLLNIDFCNNVSEIGNYSFGNCDGLIHLDIPNSVTKIGNQAFDNCSSIESITIGEKLSVMGEFPFLGCFSLREFIVNSKNSDYSVVDGVLFNKNATILIQYPYSKQGNFIIPGTTNHIANYAFVLANGLANVTIPETVISIGTAAFFQCNNLESITVKSVSPINLSLVESVFDGVSKDGCVLYVPYGAKLAYENAIQWLDFTNIVELSLTETGKVDNRRIKIYPNPVRDELHLEYDGEAHFEIVSLVGQLIYKGSLVKTTIVKTSHLLPGVYLIRFTEGKAISTLKFVKE